MHHTGSEGKGLLALQVFPSPVLPSVLNHTGHTLTPGRQRCRASTGGAKWLWGSRVWRSLACCLHPGPALTCSSFISFSARSLSAVSASSSWEADSPVFRSSVSSDVSSEIWGWEGGSPVEVTASLSQNTRAHGSGHFGTVGQSVW